jgi:uncharacterized protein
MRLVFILSGFFSAGLGVIGAVLPVMPSTCFFILAAYFFGRSSPKIEAWFLNHPKVGPTIQAWRRYRAMSRGAKMAALMGMTIGQVFLLVTWPSALMVAIGTVFIAASAWYVISRPNIEFSYCTQAIESSEDKL